MSRVLCIGKLLHPAAGSLHVEKFLNLEKLYLKPPESAYWAVNGKAVKTLQPLTRLKELVLVLCIVYFTQMLSVTLVPLNQCFKLFYADTERLERHPS